MSRAFVKDDAWEDPVVAPRAPLPPGVPNYVTPRGLALLHEEAAELDAARSRLEADATLDDGVRRRRAAALAQRRSDLAARIASAQPVDPALGATQGDTVRFGRRVTLRDGGALETFRIVGVDEADPEAGRVAFTVPLAQAVLGHHVGEVVTLRAAGGTRTLRIEGVDDVPDTPPET